MSDDPQGPVNSPAPLPFLTEDAAAAYHHFAALAADISDDALEGWHGEEDLIRTNVRRGVDAVRPYEARVRRALPLVLLHEIYEMPGLALGLGFAAGRVFVAASPQEIKERRIQLRKPRSLTLRMLEILGELEHVPQARVQAIRAGNGAIDEAQDAVQIAAMFQEYKEPLAGMHPFPDAYLQQMAGHGNWLLAQLLPHGATPPPSARSPESRIRDQLWTLLNRRYDELYKVGIEIFGRRKVDEHIPALRSRVAAGGGSPSGDPAKG